MRCLVENLIRRIAEDKNWQKWVAANSAPETGTAAALKEGCVCIAQQKAPLPKTGCIS